MPLESLRAFDFQMIRVIKHQGDTVKPLSLPEK